jgi:hypothetical protein
MADAEDKDIVIVLPIKTWRTIVAHLQSGIHRDVDPILIAIRAQADPQVIAAHKDAAERVAAEQAAIEASIAASLAEHLAKEAARAPIQPDAPADDLSDAQSTSRPSALH